MAQNLEKWVNKRSGFASPELKKKQQFIDFKILYFINNI